MADFSINLWPCSINKSWPDFYKLLSFLTAGCVTGGCSTTRQQLKKRNFWLHYSLEGLYMNTHWPWCYSHADYVPLLSVKYWGANPLIMLNIWCSFCCSTLSCTGSSPTLLNSSPTWVKQDTFNKYWIILFCITCSLFLNLDVKPLNQSEQAESNWRCTNEDMRSFSTEKSKRVLVCETGTEVCCHS